MEQVLSVIRTSIEPLVAPPREAGTPYIALLALVGDLWWSIVLDTALTSTQFRCLDGLMRCTGWAAADRRPALVAELQAKLAAAGPIAMDYAQEEAAVAQCQTLEEALVQVVQLAEEQGVAAFFAYERPLDHAWIVHETAVLPVFEDATYQTIYDTLKSGNEAAEADVAEEEDDDLADDLAEVVQEGEIVN